MNNIKDQLEATTGESIGEYVELSFDELGLSETSLNKRVGKVGFKTSLTEFVKSARRRSIKENPIAPNQAD